jgi:nucleotide-binding universal stress UspA family protein
MTMTKVIACIDGTSVSTSVSDYASWASLRLAAPLTLLHVLDKSEYPTQSNLSGNIGLGSREALLQELAELDEKRGKLALEQGRLMLKLATERAMADGVSDPANLQRHGNLVETLTEMEEQIRLLVMGKHDENLGKHIGSRLETVVRTMHRPILVCPPAFKTPQRFMIAFDGSATTHKGIDMVAASPLFKGLPCHVVMAGPDNETNRGELQWARHTLEASGFEVKTALLKGDVERALCDYRKENSIDMLVMGAYGHSVIRRFLVGSTTTAVVRNAQIPVLLLR